MALRPIWLKLAAGLVVALLAAGAVGLAVYVWGQEKTEAADTRIDDEDAIVGAKAAVGSRLPEAQAINFGQVFVYWTENIPSVCGQVDIIEDQDSFDGPERFVYSEGVLSLEELDGSDAVAQKWKDLCE